MKQQELKMIMARRVRLARNIARGGEEEYRSGFGGKDRRKETTGKN
jgi:hypothetical protein